MTTIAGSGIGLNLSARGVAGAGMVNLAAGQVQIIPAGNWIAAPGPYTFVQVLDPITGVWRNAVQTPNAVVNIDSDGVNYRLANQTGCVVGVITTTNGTSYVAPTTSSNTSLSITASTGGATFSPVVGGAIAATGTFANVGTGYTKAPFVVIPPPPKGGIPATAHVTISGSTGSTLVIDNQGGGYTSAPTATIVNDPRDTSGTGMTITLTLNTLTTAIAGVLVTDHGVPIGTAPTLSSANSGTGTSWAGSAIMCLAITSFTVASAGSVFSTNANGAIQIAGQLVTSAAGTIANTAYCGNGIFTPRGGVILLAGGTSLSSASSAIVDAGLSQSTAVMGVFSSNTIPSSAGALTCTMGGVADVSYLFPC